MNAHPERNGTARQCILSVVAGRTIIEDGQVPGIDTVWWRGRGQDLFDTMKASRTTAKQTSAPTAPARNEKCMDFAQRTIDLAQRNVEEGGRPFATVIARAGQVIAESPNLVAQTHDPTAHAEILAIRKACAKLGTEHLQDATIFVLAEPCPMCLGSLYYCSPREVVFLTTRTDYAEHYVDDRKYFELGSFYTEFSKPWNQRRLPMRYDARPDAVDVYRLWQERNGGNRRVAGAVVT